MRTINVVDHQRLDASIDCPHCGLKQVVRARYMCAQFDVDSHEHKQSRAADGPRDVPYRQSGGIVLIVAVCLNVTCKRTIAWSEWATLQTFGWNFDEPSHHRWILPEFNPGRPLPSGLPVEIQRDHLAARQIMSISTAASSALLRRCLEHYLRHRYDVTSSSITLNHLIQHHLLQDSEVSERGSVKSIDEVRQAGNIGAHALFSKSVGELIDIDVAELELMFQVVENLYNDLEISLPRERNLRASITSKYKKQ